jgi:hypothetical protein
MRISEPDIDYAEGRRPLSNRTPNQITPDGPPPRRLIRLVNAMAPEELNGCGLMLGTHIGRTSERGSGLGVRIGQGLRHRLVRGYRCDGWRLEALADDLAVRISLGGIRHPAALDPAAEDRNAQQRLPDHAARL